MSFKYAAFLILSTVLLSPAVTSMPAKISAAAATAVPHLKGIQIKNKGNESLWVEMTAEDSFLLPAGQLASIILQSNWSGTIIARTEDCQYRKCNGPYTIAEFKLDIEGKPDYYHVSIRNGFNKPMKIKPFSPHSFCKSSSCLADINSLCPKSHQIRNEDETRIVACKPEPTLFQDMCPQSFLADGFNTCSTTDSYTVSIG